jgi:hypothetical protein
MEGDLLLYVPQNLGVLSSSENVVPCVGFAGFWMSDKPLVQQALASELAELLLTISDTPSALHFLRGFWITLVREWNGIDRLRCVHLCFLGAGNFMYSIVDPFLSF